jgi:hypothetical protein
MKSISTCTFLLVSLVLFGLTSIKPSFAVNCPATIMPTQLKAAKMGLSRINFTYHDGEKSFSVISMNFFQGQCECSFVLAKDGFDKSHEFTSDELQQALRGPAGFRKVVAKLGTVSGVCPAEKSINAASLFCFRSNAPSCKGLK